MKNSYTDITQDILNCGRSTCNKSRKMCPMNENKIYLINPMDEYYGAIRGYVCDEKDADVVAWGCKEAKAPLEKIYYKHSELKPDELLVDIHYTGLCHSDHFKLHCLWDPAEYSPWPMIAGH